MTTSAQPEERPMAPPPSQSRAAASERPQRRSSAGPILFLIALLVFGGGFLGFYFLEHQPARSSLGTARRELRQERRAREGLARRAAALQSERDRLAARLSELEASESALRGERDALRAEHQQSQAALAAMQEAQDNLRGQLGRELASGEAELTGEGGELFIRLHDRILFAAGEAELNERGREVMTRVAASLVSLPGRTIRVEGHTDSQPIRGESAARYPTNWELSTTRATTVVRFLEEQGVPSARMAAVGYGPHRPVASNGTSSGRQRNRRIELVLVRAPE